VGIDLSPAGVRQANADAARLGIGNAEFVEPAFQDTRDLPPADAVIAIFFLHHLPDAVLAELPERLKHMLKPGGMFYSLDPRAVELFRKAGLEVRSDMHDFLSSPLAGVFPGWRSGYRVARVVDDAILSFPGLRQLGSNFEIIARR
jgi:SAM-dependent methyltransferase